MKNCLKKNKRTREKERLTNFERKVNCAKTTNGHGTSTQTKKNNIQTLPAKQLLIPTPEEVSKESFAKKKFFLEII